jgi:hypothetical protein
VHAAKTSKKANMKITKSQEFISKFFGTMVLILFGCGSVAMAVLFGSQPPIPREVVKGGDTNIVLGWGLAVVFGIYVAGTISGAHINPAVSNPAVSRFSPRSGTICGALSTGKEKDSQFLGFSDSLGERRKIPKGSAVSPTARSLSHQLI